MKLNGIQKQKNLSKGVLQEKLQISNFCAHKSLNHQSRNSKAFKTNPDTMQPNYQIMPINPRKLRKTSKAPTETPKHHSRTKSDSFMQNYKPLKSKSIELPHLASNASPVSKHARQLSLLRLYKGFQSKLPFKVSRGKYMKQLHDGEGVLRNNGKQMRVHTIGGCL